MAQQMLQAEEYNKEKEKKDRIEKLSQSKFKQQTLSALRPIPSPGSAVITFLMFSVLFFGLGIAMLSYSNSIVEASVEYTDCKNWEQCTVELTLEKEAKAPVYVYYKLENFFQNHRRYVKSRVIKQLKGEYLDVDKLGECDPIIKVEHLWMEYRKNVKGNPLDASAPAIPCGLMAKSYFNDTFILQKQNGYPIQINDQGIAWSSDILKKFKNIENAPEGKSWEDVQWIDMEDEHFIVWMRNSGLPTFRKLWGKVEQDLQPGKYKVVINNQYNVQPFEGKKHVILSTANYFGGNNHTAAIVYIVIGALCLLATLFFAIEKVTKKKIL